MSENFIPPNAKFVPPDPASLRPAYPRPPDPSRDFDEVGDRRACKYCGGWGKGLLWPDRTCSHCRRVKKLKFDPESDPQTCAGGEGFFDISPAQDGGVLKKVLHVPSITDPIRKDLERDMPVEGCPCFVQYVGRRVNGEIFDTTRDVVDGVCIGGTDDPFEFLLLREKVVQGFDLGVATMVVGEKARFIIRADYGYRNSPPESLPKVFPNDTLDYEIELESIKPPLPRFPTQEEMEASKKERQEEAREELKNNPPIPYAERCREAFLEKDKGNELFAKGDWDGAKKCYDSGMIHVFIHKDEWNHVLKEEDKKMINDVKAVLHLNRCACRLKMGHWDDALWDADRSIEYKEGNSKAHYRRLLVYTGKLTEQLEKEDKKIFWDVAKARKLAEKARKDLSTVEEINANEGKEEDGQTKRARLDLERKEKLLDKFDLRYTKQQKKLYGEKMLGTLNEKYEKMKLREKKRAEVEEDVELEDMPELDCGDDDDDDDDDDGDESEQIN